MAKYKCNDPEFWLPAWARGKNLGVQVVRLRSKDGLVHEITLDVNNETGDILDERCIRHLDADPRFTKVQ